MNDVMRADTYIAKKEDIVRILQEVFITRRYYYITECFMFVYFAIRSSRIPNP